MKSKAIASIIIKILLACCLLACSCSSNSQPEIIPPGGGKTDPPAEEDEHVKNGYTLQSSMQGSSVLAGKDYKAINTYMLPLGWNYTEHPNITDNDHNVETHGENVHDPVLNQYVFKLTLHANSQAIDGDRGELIDRQRNEIKSQADKRQWDKMNGNWGEWQVLEWKFKIPKGFRPSSSFTHIHQLKAFEGNNTLPLITVTLRANSDGSNRRLQVIYTGDAGNDSKKYLIDKIPLEQLEDEWVKVSEESHFDHNGYHSIKFVRLSDNKILAEHTEKNIDMWHRGAISIRNKFGIYRSFGKPLSETGGVITNGIKDECIYLGDFRVYEKNTNPDPQPHD